MKTSNKILLGIFVFPLFIVAAINIALFAKYKSGNYVAMSTAEQDRHIRQTLTNIHYVSVYGINNCNIKPADTARFEIERDEHDHLHYSIVGDSLIIHGDSTVKRHGEDEIERSYQAVNLFLPGDVFIAAVNSDIYIDGSKDSTDAKSYRFQLGSSASCKMRETDPGDSVLQYFNSIDIKTSGSSSIELSGNARIKQLNVTLQDTQFDDKKAGIEILNVEADKSSTLTLTGDNLKKIKPNL